MRKFAPPPVHYAVKPTVQPKGAEQPGRVGKGVPPPPTRYGGVQPALQAKAAARTHAPPPTRYAPAAGAAVQASRPFAGAPGGLVIQATWVYIGSATTKTNMTDLSGGRYRHTVTGKTYATVRIRDGAPEVAEEVVGDDDELSQYSQHSLDDLPGTFSGFGGRSAVVLDTYSNNRHSMVEPINTSAGLKEAVLGFDTAKNATANTHVMYKGATDTKYSFVPIGTATAVRLYLKRFGFEQLIQNVQSRWGKGAHVHAEMHLIHSVTGGNAGAIDNCLNGYTLVVDKEVCADCYPYVVRASPSEVRDGTDFLAKGAAERQSWEDWSNPFG